MKAWIVLFLLSSPSLSQLPSKLYWTNEWGIHRSNLDGSDMERNLVKPDLRRPNSIVVDPSNDKIYWVNGNVSGIYRSDLDGSNLEIFETLLGVYSSRLYSPRVSFDVDTVHGRLIMGEFVNEGDYHTGMIYWADLDRERLGMVTFSGPWCGGVIPFTDVAVDTLEQTLYFAGQGWGDIFKTHLEYIYIDPDTTTVWPCPYEDIVSIVQTQGKYDPPDFDLDLKGRKIYWIEDGTHINRADLDGSNIELVLDGLGVYAPRNLDLDLEGHRLYWLERGRLTRSNLDGSQVERDFLGQSGAIDFEVYDGWVYWSDSRGRVRRASLDNLVPHDVFAPSIRSTTGLALDPSRDKVYWTDHVKGSVWSSDLDGSRTKALIEGLQGPSGIALAESELYWIDGQSAIRKSDLDGSNIEDIVQDRSITNIAFDGARERLFWSGRCSDFVWSCNPDGSAIDSLFVSDSECPGDIAVDEATGHIYWAHRHYGGSIWRIAVGDHSSTPIRKHESEEPVALAFDWSQGKMYWTVTSWGPEQSSSTYVLRSELNGSNEEWVFPLGRVSDMALYSPPTQTSVSSPPPLPSTAACTSFPNPFNSTTAITFLLEEESPVSLTVHSITGQLVNVLDDSSSLRSGFHVRHWHGDDQGGRTVASGVYLYRLDMGGQVHMGKLALVR